MKLGSNIKKYRIEKRLTQERFAYELGVTAQAVSRWENDITYPDMQCGARRLVALIHMCKKEYALAKEIINGLPSYRCGREIMMERLIKASEA